MKVLVTFTYGISLKRWKKEGYYSREVFFYEKLANKNIEFYFLTYGNDSDKIFQPNLKKIKIIPVQNYIRSNNKYFSLLKSFFLPFLLRKQLKDINIVKTNQLYGSWVAILLKLFYRKKLIIRGGYEWLKLYIIKFKMSKRKKFLKFLLKYLLISFLELIAYHLADVIILTNRLDIEFIKKFFKLNYKRKRIFQVYNYIDTSLFKPISIRKKSNKILYIGRLSYEKNLFNLIRVFKANYEFSLDIIGDGNLKSELIKEANQIGAKINFLGKFPNEQLPQIINQYPIFILPSFHEGNPKTLLEAMSCGIPCICTNVPGINNIIKHKFNGYLCEINSNSIRTAINKLYYNKNLRMKLSKNARNFIIENCSLKNIITKEYNIYKKLYCQKMFK
ncbi:MAG: glycosyltransferase family 4 protein [Promethearchaeota archaeon]